MAGKSVTIEYRFQALDESELFGATVEFDRNGEDPKDPEEVVRLARA